MDVGTLMKRLTMESAYIDTDNSIIDNSSDMEAVIEADILKLDPPVEDKTIVSLEASLKILDGLQLAEVPISVSTFKIIQDQVVTSLESSEIPVNSYDLNVIEMLESFESTGDDDYSSLAQTLLTKALDILKAK